MEDNASMRAWHELLDELALERGHRDNLALAQALCDNNGNSNQTAFDTAVKNLRNWRAGHHLPQRRNFLLLSQLLEVETLDLERIEAWHAAYNGARKASVALERALAAPRTFPGGERPVIAPAAGGDSGHKNETATVRDFDAGAKRAEALAPKPSSRPRRLAVALALGLGLGLAAGLAAGLVMGALLVPHSIRLAFDIPATFAGANGKPLATALLKEGQSMVIGSVAAPRCETDPPLWEAVASGLPELETGRFSDGGPGSLYEPACGSRVGARGVLFSATDAGEEQFMLAGEPILIKVY